MINTSVTFSAGAYSSKQKLSSPTEHAANFAHVLANYSPPAKEKKYQTALTHILPNKKINYLLSTAF